MAKIEIINEATEVNVSASVGRNGVNNKDDVIAVQALMKYALEGRGGPWQGIIFPHPSGAMDSTTRTLIKKYQRHMKRRNENVKVDGRIDPADGVYTNKGTVWTISALNGEALETWLVSKRFGVNHIHAIGLLYPVFKVAIGDQGVGTLNLPLDGGSNGVGTLGLELE